MIASCNYYTITGTVYDKHSGSTLYNVSVLINRTDTMKTNGEGFFYFTNIKKGNNNLEFSYPNYIRINKIISVAKKGNNVVKMPLTVLDKVRHGICPVCNKEDEVYKIVYGARRLKPTKYTIDKLDKNKPEASKSEKEKIIYAGCVRFQESPGFKCLRDNVEW